MSAEPRLDRRRRNALAALAALVTVAVVSQAALSAWLECADPCLRDPEYGTRLARLRQRAKEQPDRPLAVVLGSSRVAMGVRPAVVDEPRNPTGPDSSTSAWSAPARSWNCSA